MKKIVAVLCGLITVPAFAEIVPDWYQSEESVQYADDDSVLVDDKYNVGDDSIAQDTVKEMPVVQQPVAPSPRNNINRSATRAVASQPSRDLSVRATASRPVASRTVISNVPGTQQPMNTKRRISGSIANTARAGLLQSDTVSTPLYNSATTTSARVGVRPTTTTSRMPAVRAATTSIVNSTSNSETAVSAGTSMEEIAQLTDFCKAQYYSCMDNFCSVLDDNQGRCSCSANIKNYAKTETALKAATEELQNVAQQIQYIGLGKDDVDTLFTQTEAEQSMAGRTDTTELRADLDKIKKLIVDIKSPSATSSSDTGGLDLSSLFSSDFSGTGFDLSNLFGDNTAGSVSNQRGAELYKTASSRCKTSVIDNCRAQGVDTNIITNGYDLEIDKQCIAYERSLDDANTNMRRTVRNATSVLQKARLAVAQEKNSYDLRGCVNALDSCMQDEFVCGSDYENCLDPTGTFIVNGEVVVGSRPGIPLDGTVTTVPTNGLYKVWNYTNNTSNAWIDTRGTLSGFVTADIGAVTPDQNRMVGYLQEKIGYNSNGRNYGMCVSVLNKCQDISYGASTKLYERNNKAVESYLQRTLVQIKAKQDEVLQEYAEGCISDVRSCLSTNGGTQQSSQTVAGGASTTVINACRSVVNTCASVSGSTASEIVIKAVCFSTGTGSDTTGISCTVTP